MDYGSMLSDSFGYTKNCFFGSAKRWLLLAVCLAIFPFIFGYLVRIYRGEKPAPEPGQWGSLFIDGLKLLAVQIVYAIPVVLMVGAALLPFVSAVVSSGILSDTTGTMTEAQAEALFAAHPEIMSSFGLMLVLLLCACIAGLVIAIVSYIGIVRFARTDSMAEAFNFSAILAAIRNLGWVNYLLALLVIFVIGMVYGFVLNIVMMIPIIGIVLFLLLYPPFLVLMGRYAALVYDNADGTGSAAPQVATE